MRIISEIETTPRRIYTGSIGYISPQRKAKFNVAIRTALIDRETQKAEYGVVVALFGIPPVRTNMQKPCSKPEC